MCGKGVARHDQHGREANKAKEAFVDWQRKSSERIRNGGGVESGEGFKTAAPCRNLEGTPESRRVMRRDNGKRRDRKAGQLDGGAETIARQGDISYVTRIVGLEKLYSVKAEPKKMKQDQYSLIVGLPLTEGELEQMRGEERKKDVLNWSLWKAAKATKSGGG